LKNTGRNVIFSYQKNQFLMKNAYTNLVFEGGGVKGIAYAGAIKVLEEQNILASIEKVAGTSAGAITAALVSLNYTSQDITSIINNLNFTLFEDGWDPVRLPFTYGLYSGDYFLRWIEDKIRAKLTSAGGGQATFADLKEQGFRDLHVFATDLNIFDIREFSYEATPDVIVAEAVRASMSIPLFFKAWRFSNNVPDDHIYVDGGTVLNYPITVFDRDNIRNTSTLGFYLYDYDNKKVPASLKFDEIIRYGKVLFETLLNAQSIDFEVNPEEEARTVKINDFGILATDFGITAAQKQALYDSGVLYTKKFLGLG
jgi:NTE family protein